MTQKQNKVQGVQGELTDEQLEGVNGGMMIPVLPKVTYPKLHAPSSIAQGEINSNSTDNNLPDSGGGIIK